MSESLGPTLSVIYRGMEVIESGRSKTGWFFKLSELPDSVFHVVGEGLNFNPGDKIKLIFEREADAQPKPTSVE